MRDFTGIPGSNDPRLRTQEFHCNLEVSESPLVSIPIDHPCCNPQSMICLPSVDIRCRNDDVSMQSRIQEVAGKAHPCLQTAMRGAWRGTPVLKVKEVRKTAQQTAQCSYTCLHRSKCLELSHSWTSSMQETSLPRIVRQLPCCLIL